MMTATMQEKAAKSPVLDPEYHARLIADIESVAKKSGVPMAMLLQSCEGICSEEEVAFVKGLRTHAADGVYGLLYTGAPKAGKTPINMRMMALAAAMLRNYIDARVITVQDVLAQLKKGTPPEPTVLLVPNFFIGKEQGGSIPAWQSSELLSLLMNRQALDMQTFLYVEDLDLMAAQYGEIFKQHLTTNFVACK